MKKTFFFASFLFLLFQPTVSQAAAAGPVPILPPALHTMPLRELLGLTTKEISEKTGYRPGFRQKLAFTLFRSSMKNAVRKDPGITAGEFFSSKKMKGWLLALLIVLGILLVIFVIFAISYGGQK